MLYIPDPNPDGSPVTWGQLFLRPHVKRALQSLHRVFETAGNLDIYFLNKEIFQHCLFSKPVRFCVESQFILKEYLAMRKQSHIWYRLLPYPSRLRWKLSFASAFAY